MSHTPDWASFDAQGLWHLMQHSQDPDRTALAVTAYFDDSITAGGVGVAVLGGLLLNQTMWYRLDSSWHSIRNRYRIGDALHMTDFVRPHGKHCAMPPELKIGLFREVAEVINQNKVYSLAVSVPQDDFESLLPAALYKKLIGPYAFACAIAIMVNHLRAAHDGFNERIAYLIDSGSSSEPQLRAAHKAIQQWQKTEGVSVHTGPMASDADENNSALQAADVIAWASRRITDEGLTHEFIPLQAILEDYTMPFEDGRPGVRRHFPYPMKRDAVVELADWMNEWLVQNGAFPQSLIEMAGPPKGMIEG